MDWPNSLFFSHKMLLVALLPFTSFETILLNCIVTGVISAWVKKTNTKLDCVAICSSHWRWKKKSNTFSILCFIISRKVKTQLKCKKTDLCSVWRRCCDWWNMSKWFVKFRAGGFSLDNAPRSGRPVEVDSDQIEKLTENNHRYTPQELVDILKIPKSNTENHLHQLGYVNRFDVWVPRK